MESDIDIKNIYEKLFSIAKEDGIVKADEKALIQNIMSNIGKYFQIIDQNFVGSLKEFHENRKKIMDEAMATAKADNNVSDDEYSILLQLQKILEEIEENTRKNN